MTTNRCLLAVLLIAAFSCTPKNNGTSQTSSLTHENFVPPAPKAVIGKDFPEAVLEKKTGGRLRHACSIVPLDNIAVELGLDPTEIIKRNATPKDADPNQTACFYKWEDYDLPNAGLFIQFIRNPLGDEYPTYVSTLINGKREQGERDAEGHQVIFKTFEGFGDDGAYSTEGGKYFWRLGESVVMHIAFNTTHGPEEQYNIATNLATLITNAYIGNTEKN